MTPPPPPATAYKILTADQWAGFVADRVFAGAPIDRADGFIHLSTEDQLAGTLARHFAGQAGLVLATVDLGRLGDTLRWEPARGGLLFPHVYGTLPLEVIAETRALDQVAEDSSD